MKLKSIKDSVYYKLEWKSKNPLQKKLLKILRC